MITAFYKKFHQNRFKMRKLYAFEYLQMDCNGNGHIRVVGFVILHGLI